MQDPRAPAKSTDQTAFQEGQRASREASYFARNAGLAKAAKHHDGTTCQGCRFNFADAYGDIGEDYIEVHQTPDRRR
jgi:5-methylcytosine-specific restriction protein A